jgi:hypothetical protein
MAVLLSHRYGLESERRNSHFLRPKLIWNLTDLVRSHGDTYNKTANAAQKFAPLSSRLQFAYFVEDQDIVNISRACRAIVFIVQPGRLSFNV